VRRSLPEPFGGEACRTRVVTAVGHVKRQLSVIHPGAGWPIPQPPHPEPLPQVHSGAAGFRHLERPGRRVHPVHPTPWFQGPLLR